MIMEQTVLFSGFVIVMLLLALKWESTILFGLGAGISFVMMVFSRLIVVPYAYVTGGTLVTGSFILDDSSASILFFGLGVLNVVLYFVFTIQHAKEALQRGEQEEDVIER